MKNIVKYLLALVLLASMSALVGCQQTTTQPQVGDPYTVTFVDYDGTVLKSISCTVGTACDITAPATPTSKPDFLHWSVFPDQYSSIQTDTQIKAVYALGKQAFSIFGHPIEFYAVFIMTGIAVALILGLIEIKRTGIKQDDLIDGFLWIVPVSILGARLWYVAFEPASFFLGDGLWRGLLRAIGFQIQFQGSVSFANYGLAGLAIHGAFVTAVICTYFYTRKRKIDIFKVLDIIAVGFIIAQAFGRWGNFFNQEAHGPLVGGITNGVMNWTWTQQYDFLRYTLHLPNFIVNNMYIIGNGTVIDPLTGFYHPTFFYESMLNLIGFAIMLVLRRFKKIHFGELMAFYLVWYGSVRIFIEILRTDPLTFQFLGITFKTAIVTSVLLILLGIAFDVFLRIKRKNQVYGTVPGCFGSKRNAIPMTDEPR